MTEETKDESTGEEQQYYSWRDGLPTGPDVTVLQKTFADLRPGDRIPYEMVVEAVGIPMESNRWKTVTNAWRKRELERGIVIDCDPGVAFMVLTADQISGKTWGAYRHIGKTARKQRGHLATIRGTSEDERRVVLHQMQLLAGTERDAKKNRMNLLPATETKSAPRIAPPKKNSA